MLQLIKINIRKVITWIARRNSDKTYLSYLFKHRIGRELNWDNPQSFMEKINYLKIKNKNNYKIKLFADKYTLREMLVSINLEKYKVPLKYVFNDFAELKYNLTHSNNLDACFIKVSNDCASSILFDGKNQKVVLKKIQEHLKYQKKFLKITCEYQYESKSRIIAEENLDNGSLYDFKIFLSAGNVIQVMCSCGKQLAFYNKNMELLKVRLRASVRGELHPQMDHLPKLERKKIKNHINLIASAFKEFEFCRVDMLTNINHSDVFINEVTFSPSSGLKYFEPQEYDFELGKKVILKDQ